LPLAYGFSLAPSGENAATVSPILNDIMSRPTSNGSL
jgi:hypothetical protein